MTDAADMFDKLSLLQLAFKGLDETELQDMAALSHFQTYPAGYILCHEGAFEDVFYIVADGSVVITQQLQDEEGERVLREGGKGDVVGEMALIQNAPRAATVRTTSECTALEMSKADFETILSRSPRLAIEIIGITLNRLRANDRAAIADLQKTNKILRQLDRNKMEFIQVAAHELRTPLTVIKGYLGLMKSFPEIKANPTISATLGGIEKGTSRMHEVVNTMLDVTRMDNETAKPIPAPISLTEFVDDTVESFQIAAAERQIELTVRHAADTPDLQADPDMLQKALYQLVVNAIKYTPDGGRVTVSTRPVRLDGDLPGAEIAVQDSGIGLDAEHHELVFDKFYQVNAAALHSSGKTSFKGGGPGLGLALVRGVARAHGGKTWVESPGHDEVNFPGCTFFLQLPLEPPTR